jgi:hypothetical protein
VDRAVDVAATNRKQNVLAALTSAAMTLPGIKAQSAVSVAQAQANVQYNNYQESDGRMNVEVYHGNFVVPVTDRLEFSVNIDRDTYSGATPSFSIPETLTNLPKISGATTSRADLVSAASGPVNAQELTTLGGLNTFKQVFNGLTAADQQKQNLAQQAGTGIETQKQQAIADYVAANPSPNIPSTIPGPITLGFNFISSATYGKANISLGGCNPQSCLQEKGMIIGTINDPLNDGGHVHKTVTGIPNPPAVQYHNDASGIYIRALNGQAFSAESLILNSLDLAGNGPNDYWEILGFNTALNPNLSTGDGTNYANRTAYQQVFGLRTGILALDAAFQNINALWIHYKGYVQDVINTSLANGVDWDLKVDDIKLDSAKIANATPEQLAWLAAYNAFVTNLDLTFASQTQAITNQANESYKQAAIRVYRNFLNRLVPPKTKAVQRFQQQPQETRTQPVFGAKYYFDNATLGLSYGQSNEPDYQSSFGGLNYTHELNNKLTTLSAGYNFTSNHISRNTGDSHGDHHSTDPNHNPTDYPELDADSESNSFNLGFTQVLNKNSLLQMSANYSRQSGYLTNPYKNVYIRGEVTAEEYYQLSQAIGPGDINWSKITSLEMVGLELFREVRPDLRNQFSISTRLNQYIPQANAALHMDYRYYIDDWGIDSHTAELRWLQSLPWGLTVTPSLRYYSQSAADFFAPYFLAPRADGNYSSDFRLSGYGALSGGLTVTKQFNRGISLELGMEYYTHQGDLKLGGGGESDYADFSYWMAHAGLNIALSAPGNLFGGGEGGHHHHHGAPVPAGIMFGHMMPNADDIMVGYRYQYTNQDGATQHGSNVINDTVLINDRTACGKTRCSARPTQMAMHMHMLDLMYAPTDWLNLMLMPQLMDMDMGLKALPGADPDNLHGGGHESHGLGDTYLMALIKAFDIPHHHLHVGLGVSAPTGSVEETLDGFDEPDSELQDYGMQLGSGTWDFRPSITYTGQTGDWSWGAQVYGVKRLENRNESGYVLGDLIQASAWGSYSFTHWLSTSVRGIFTEQGRIKGAYKRPSSEGATVDNPANSRGTFWDVGIGLNLSAPGGAFAGHSLSVEWQQPVADRFNGYQLEREGTLAATWNYAF